MVAVASCFAQILSLIDRAGFARAVRQHQAERGTQRQRYLTLVYDLRREPWITLPKTAGRRAWTATTRG
jgi:hypothetical protein